MPSRYDNPKNLGRDIVTLQGAFGQTIEEVDDPDVKGGKRPGIILDNRDIAKHLCQRANAFLAVHWKASNQPGIIVPHPFLRLSGNAVVSAGPADVERFVITHISRSPGTFESMLKDAHEDYHSPLRPMDAENIAEISGILASVFGAGNTCHVYTPGTGPRHQPGISLPTPLLAQRFTEEVSARLAKDWRGTHSGNVARFPVNLLQADDCEVALLGNADLLAQTAALLRENHRLYRDLYDDICSAAVKRGDGKTPHIADVEENKEAPPSMADKIAASQPANPYTGIYVNDNAIGTQMAEQALMVINDTILRIYEKQGIASPFVAPEGNVQVEPWNPENDKLVIGPRGSLIPRRFLPPVLFEIGEKGGIKVSDKVSDPEFALYWFRRSMEVQRTLQDATLFSKRGAVREKE